MDQRALGLNTEVLYCSYVKTFETLMGVKGDMFSVFTAGLKG